MQFYNDNLMITLYLCELSLYCRSAGRSVFQYIHHSGALLHVINQQLTTVCELEYLSSGCME